MSNDSGSNKMLWIGASSLVAVCPSLACCVFALITFAGATTYESEFDGITSAGTVNPMMGFVFLCLALIPWLLPACVWYYFRHKEAGATPPPPSIGRGFSS